jgi:hypothetical protein
VKHFSGTPLKDRPLALPTSIRLGWKGLSGTNNQAYYSSITAVESFIILTPGLDSVCDGGLKYEA